MLLIDQMSCLKVHLHMWILSQELNAIFVMLKLQFEHPSGKSSDISATFHYNNAIATI